MFFHHAWGQNWGEIGKCLDMRGEKELRAAPYISFSVQDVMCISAQVAGHGVTPVTTQIMHTNRVYSFLFTLAME